MNKWFEWGVVIFFILVISLYFGFRDLKRVRIVFKGGHVETLWVSVLKTERDGNSLTKMNWKHHWSSRKIMMNIDLSEVAAILWR